MYHRKCHPQADAAGHSEARKPVRTLRAIPTLMSGRGQYGTAPKLLAVAIWISLRFVIRSPTGTR